MGGVSWRGRPGRVGVAIRRCLANGRDRPPEVVLILGVKGGNVAVGESKVEKRKESRVFPQGESCGGRNGTGDAIPLQDRTLHPEPSNLGLLGGTRTRGDDSIIAEALDLIEISRVFLTADGMGRTRSKLGGIAQHEGRDSAPLRAAVRRRLVAGQPLHRLQLQPWRQIRHLGQQVSGGDPVQITKGPGHNWQPDWSPDGKYIAYRSEDGEGGLFVIPALGGAGLERRIAAFGYYPRWSPDSSQTLFQTTQFDMGGFYEVGLDGSPPVRY